MSKQRDEPELIELNMADLDVEELEQRLELASLAPTSDCWNHNTVCEVNDSK